MSKKNVYPLQQVAEIKKKRLDEAEKVLKEKRLLLEQEQNKLKKAEQERDEVKLHKDEKLAQLRKGMDEGVAPEEVLQMHRYIKLVQEKLAAKEKKVIDHKKQVDIAEKNVKIAKDDVSKKQQDIEKINIHKKEWQKEDKKEQERLEGIENDELGSQVFLIKKSKDPIAQELKKNKS